MFHVLIYKDLESLSVAAKDHFFSVVSKAVEQKGSFYVVMTGGNTVKGLFKCLASPSNIGKIDWNKGLFFWGDERLVPPDHPESNYGQAYQLFLRHLELKKDNIFRIRGELDSEEAVQDYKEKLRENASEGMEWPDFDLIFLGMGSDGHIASIFPGEISEAEQHSPVVATKADYQGRPADRVSMTPLVFNSGKEIFFLVSGESKAATLRQVLYEEGDPKEYPALRIRPENGVITWFVDEAAASLLPRDLLRSQRGMQNEME